MTIEQIDAKRLLISLCDDDMRAFSLDFATMGFKDADSKRVIKRLLLLAGARTGIQLSNKSLTVEALPHSSGCILLVTLGEKSDERKIYKIKKSGYAVFAFGAIEDFLTANERLYQHGYVFSDSSAYLFDGRYYLLIIKKGPLKIEAENILSETGADIGDNAVIIARIKEHGKIIAQHHAVLQIGSAMAK